MNKNNLDGRNWIISPSVNKGSGLDDSGPKMRSAPIVRNEQMAVRNPTPNSNFNVDKTVGFSNITDLSVESNQFFLRRYIMLKTKKNKINVERNHI